MDLHTLSPPLPSPDWHTLTLRLRGPPSQPSPTEGETSVKSEYQNKPPVSDGSLRHGPFDASAPCQTVPGPEAVPRSARPDPARQGRRQALAGPRPPPSAGPSTRGRGGGTGSYCRSPEDAWAAPLLSGATPAPRTRTGERAGPSPAQGGKAWAGAEGGHRPGPPVPGTAAWPAPQPPGRGPSGTPRRPGRTRSRLPVPRAMRKNSAASGEDLASLTPPGSAPADPPYRSPRGQSRARPGHPPPCPGPAAPGRGAP